MSKARRNFTADQKAEVVRRHFRDWVSIGDLAAELDLQPSQIHQWVAAVLAQADRAFQNKPGRSWLSYSTSLKKIDDQYHQRHDQKNVNQISADAKTDSQSPHQN